MGKSRSLTRRLLASVLINVIHVATLDGVLIFNRNSVADRGDMDA